MPTLLLYINAPMQAWGTQSNFSHRDTGREPSKSGIIGLLCAALGRPRDHDIQDLTQLRMGVRIEQAGTVRRDYHTAGMGGYYKVDGKGKGKALIPSTRYYLSDAVFLVGLEGEHALLESLQQALQNPAWFLFFGRKAFIPTTRIWLKNGIQPADLPTTLKQYELPDYIKPVRRQEPEKLQVVLDDPNGAIVRNDHPVSFAPRRFLPRWVSTDFVDNPSCHVMED